MSKDFKVAIVDYGMGNVQSIQNALMHVGGCKVEITANKQKLAEADTLFLPGVGAFPDAMSNLSSKGLISILNEEVLNKGKPTLGICLGMQLLFSCSEEGGMSRGLDWIPGSVRKMNLNKPYRIPHIGWNNLKLASYSQIFSSLGKDRDFYFVHSYHAECEKKYVTATFEYEKHFTAAVQHKNIVGMQFHPEKSQRNGLEVLATYIDWCRSITDA